MVKYGVFGVCVRDVGLALPWELLPSFSERRKHSMKMLLHNCNSSQPGGYELSSHVSGLSPGLRVPISITAVKGF